VPAGVCCQNGDNQGGTGQRGLPLNAMPAYIQDVFDLIEWANGPANSTWGAKRAAAGHPQPFNLEYLGVGNEDAQTDVFRERFKMIYDAVKAKHPEITLIGTVGPDPSGTDYDAGWKFASEQHLEMVDEHGYKPPQWFWENLARFDAYDRTQSKVYLGEYAAHDDRRVNTLRSALAEAAYLTSLERNGDMVRLASYAPLLAREGRTQWRPDMIYFTGTNVLLSANYYVQQMFSLNCGDIFFPATIAAPPGDDNRQKYFASSCVKDSRTGDIILKLVNGSSNAIPAQVKLAQLGPIQPQATRVVLSGDPAGFNSLKHPDAIVPATTEFTAGESFACTAPPNSLTVIRMKAR